MIPGQQEPGLVVIFINGVQTQSPSDEFYPLDYGLQTGADHPAIDSYCSVGGAYLGSSYGPYPPSIPGAISGYAGQVAPPPPQGSESLPDTLAQEGAVLLPYSYRGAGFSSCPGSTPPLFKVNASGSDDPGQTDPRTAAGYLASEIRSIHRCWPDSAIDVIADSGGGVPAEYYWNTAFQTQRDGIDHIFTEDSPINGLDHPSIESFVADHLGAAVRDFYARLWANLDAVDRQEVVLDGDGSFRPIGTVGDYPYAMGDQQFSLSFDSKAELQSPNYQGLLSQVLMDCGGRPADTCSAVAPPSFISPCDASSLSGQDSHELVRTCKPVVDYIAAVTSGDLEVAEVHERSAGDHASSPVRYLPGPGPALQPLLYAARPGGRITFHGRGLGSSAGRVLFAGTPGPASYAARVTSWTDSAVTVIVPDALSGPIIIQTAAGAYLPAGGLAVLGTGAVRRLRIRVSAPQPAGQPDHVYVTALGRRGRPAGRITVSLFNGAVDLQSLTNRRGTATFAVYDSGSQSFVVHAQGAHAGIGLRWLDPGSSPFIQGYGISAGW